MRKLMLLASVVALAALTLVATPAFAQDGGDKVEVCHFPGGNPANAHIIDISVNALPAHLAEHERDFVVDGRECPPDGDDGDDGDDNGDDNGDDDGDRRDGRDVFRDIGNVEVAPVFDITQDIEQECDSAAVSQPVDVSLTGDNSIQTVGVQPTANTGCAQNATGILSVDPVVAGFGGDNVFVNDGDDNGDDNGDDGRFIQCDLDGDGNDDGVECEDFDDGLVFCDRNGDGKDDGDDDCVVFVDDDNGDNGDNGDVRIRDRGDDINIHGAQGDEFDVDSNANIDVSPVQHVVGGGTINQAATAESNTFVVKHPWWWA
jgi:hypothetical protein